MPKNDNALKRGFTLIELLMVIAIIAILTGMIIGIANLANRKSSDSKVRAELQTIANSLEEYRIAYGSYPPDLATLKLTTTAIEPQYKEFSEIDRWRNAYIYTEDTLTYTLKSYGADGVDSGDDIDLESETY